MRYLPLLILSLFLFSCTGDEETQAQTPVTAKQSTPLDKRTEFRTNPPKLAHWVNDFDSVFTPAQENELNSIIDAFEKKTSMEIAILTMDTAYVEKDSFYTMVYQVFNKWEVGKKEKNNGLIIAICKNYGMFRITTGKGTEKILTDKEAEKIMNDVFFPLLRENKFYEAFHQGTLALTTFLTPRAAQLD